MLDFLTNALGMGGNPANASRDYLSQISPMLHETYDPFIQRGEAAYPGLRDAYNPMMTNPTGYLDQLMKQYKPSQGYNLMRDEGLRAAGNTAAAGGMRGSLGDIQSQARLTDSLMGQDMQQWLNNVMGIQNTGLQGNQGFYNTGYNAASSLGSDLSNVLGTQAQLEFQGAANQNQNKSDLLSALLGAGGAAAGGYFGSKGK